MNGGEATLEVLVDRYLDRCHLGDAPDPVTFANDHPEHTAELLGILPILNDLEKVGDAARGRSVDDGDELPELTGSDFRLLRKLGGGGMGVVFEAEQLSLGRRVAVKLLSPSLMADVKRRDEFVREARIVAKLHHPYIVKVIGAGECAGVCYYAMELLDGERLDRHRFASTRDIAVAMLQAARALAYAHANQVIHRDVKPSNLMLDKDGALHVADFGLACILDSGSDSVERAGAQNGTLRYMPAERLLLGVNSFSCDQYALGVTFYEIVTGRPILSERNSHALFRHICKTAMPPLECDEPDFAAIINKCIAFEPEDRYASMFDLVEDLRHFLAHEPILGAPSPITHRLKLWMRRKPAVAAALALAALFATTSVAALVTGYLRTASALDRAERNAVLADAALSGVFTRVEHQPPTRRDAELLTELLPYYGELARRRDMTPVKLSEANRVLGTCALRTGNYALAEKAFRQLVEHCSEADAFVLLASALRRQGKDDEANEIFRNVVTRFRHSTDPGDRYAAVQAIRELAPYSKHVEEDTSSAFELLSQLLKEDPENPDYRYQFAVLLGDNPSLSPNAFPAAIRMLTRLVGEYPDRTDYAIPLVSLVESRLNQAKTLNKVQRRDFEAVMARSDRLLARHPNMPDVVSAVLRLRVAYVAYLRRIGQDADANHEAARTSGMLEMLAEPVEPPEAQRFRFTGTGGVTIGYRQIVVGQPSRTPPTMVLVQHGLDCVGTDNNRQLWTPSILPLLEYVQLHNEKLVLLVPQCPPRRNWKQLRPVLNELVQRKIKEFHVPEDRVHTIGDAPLSEQQCVDLFRRSAAPGDEAEASPMPSQESDS